jgi:hypothetical protein
MTPALQIPFERAVQEYALWRSIPNDERSGAPAWWWDTAMALIGEREVMSAASCRDLQLTAGSSYSAAAKIFMDAMNDQDFLVYPENFPRKPKTDDGDKANAEAQLTH